jgi:hypothetical protein
MVNPHVVAISTNGWSQPEGPHPKPVQLTRMRPANSLSFVDSSSITEQGQVFAGSRFF